MQSGKIVSNIEIMGGADWMNPGTTAQINYMGSMEKVFSAAEKTPPTKDIYATLEGVEFELKLLKTVGAEETISPPEVANLMLEIENLIESARAAYELGYHDSAEAVMLAALEACRALDEALKGKRAE